MRARERAELVRQVLLTSMTSSRLAWRVEMVASQALLSVSTVYARPDQGAQLKVSYVLHSLASVPCMQVPTFFFCSVLERPKSPETVSVATAILTQPEALEVVYSSSLKSRSLSVCSGRFLRILLL